MAIVQESIRAITRCHIGPNRLGNLLAHWAQQRYNGTPEFDGAREVIVSHLDRGLRMKVVPAHHIGGTIYWRGAYAHRILKCIRQYLLSDMTFVDAGANQGEVSLFAARRLHSGRVIAFEPDTANYQRLLDNVKLNELANVLARNHCLGETPGEAQLFVPHNESTHHVRGWNEGLSSMFSPQAGASAKCTVAVQPLDDVVAELSVDSIDLLKIDVEGAELSVLKGSCESLRRFRPMVVIEINSETFGLAGYAPHNVCDFLCKLGYEGFLVNRAGRLGRRVAASIPDHCDTVWMPLDRKFEIVRPTEAVKTKA